MSQETSLSFLKWMEVYPKFITGLMFAYVYVFVIIGAYHGIGNTDQSVISMAAALIAIIICNQSEKKHTRRLYLRHTKALILMCFVVDGATELCLLWDPLYKFLGDVVGYAIMSHILDTIHREQANAIWDANDRIALDLRGTKYFNAGMFIGSALALKYVIEDLSTAVYLYIAANVIYYALIYIRFKLKDNYVKKYGCVYPSHESD